ncbi:oocyte zinc finger protein XlCOF22-like isoform X2 [Synchiropus splendidus]|uniref:oocyte zinc finger protein XlCOF22-like isoform X2 n=1 Tax=Synchiropus splendidus TaxID=270530 RepID=UPI00237DDEBF|nr:oocyte zinc finger protein XlCOF22-like isoform X2 [Synchiropus splendidus]
MLVYSMCISAGSSARFHAISERSLLEMTTKTPDVQQLLASKEKVSTEQQAYSSNLDLKGQEHHHIKVEENGEDRIKEEAVEQDVCNLSFIRVEVKREYVGEEEKPSPSSLTQHIKTENDGENCASYPANYLNELSHSNHQRSLTSDSDTDDSEDWTETRNSLPGSNSVENPKDCVDEKKDDADHKSLICSGCGKNCSSKAGLMRHVKSCSPLSCSACGKCFEKRQNLENHMRSHTGEKPFSCPHCEKCFPQRGNLKEHIRIHTATGFQEGDLQSPEQTLGRG